MERNHQCKHEIHTNLLQGVRSGRGCPTSVCFHLKVTAFFLFICILTCKRCLLGHFARVFTCRTCENDDGLKLLVYYLCVAPRKHVRIRRGQWGGRWGWWWRGCKITDEPVAYLCAGTHTDCAFSFLPHYGQYSAEGFRAHFQRVGL